MNASSDSRGVDERSFALGMLVGAAADIFTSSVYDPVGVTFTISIAGQPFKLQGFIAEASEEDELDGTPLRVEDPPRRLKELTRIALAKKYGNAQTKADDIEDFDVLTVISDGLQRALTDESKLQVLWKE